jgi:hypothetical protein
MKALIFVLGFLACSSSAWGTNMAELNAIIREYTPRFEDDVWEYPSDTITFDGGGYIYRYLTAARIIRLMDRHLTINGPCGSACVVLADFARPNVCITEYASFHFHKSRKEVPGRIAQKPGWILSNTGRRGPPERKYDDPPHSPEIAGWVNAHGGFPLSDSVWGWLPMPFQDAAEFWPICGGVPHPRLRPPH